ncbi:MAG: hypothetical protein OXI80_01380 [Caldilineaceae bacterium]|nr:hypothetical protein [Caldilineaceae bacterium]MDE0336295.1 hypothetical protein [Caldilineaceae bacterium]
MQFLFDIFNFFMLLKDILVIFIAVLTTLASVGLYSWNKRRIHYRITGKRCLKDGLYYSQQNPTYQITFKKGDRFPADERGPGPARKTIWIYMQP